jgi:hypothetical protein
MSEITSKEIEKMIYVVRGQKVMLDSDLADLYCVLTKNLNKAVKRNIDKFPQDFMFKLSKKEHEDLRFQFGTFIKMRHLLASDESLTDRVGKLEKGTDKLFRIVFERLENIEQEIPAFPKDRKKIGLK